MHWPSNEFIFGALVLLALFGIARGANDCAAHLKTIADGLAAKKPSPN